MYDLESYKFSHKAGVTKHATNSAQITYIIYLFTVFTYCLNDLRSIFHLIQSILHYVKRDMNKIKFEVTNHFPF